MIKALAYSYLMWVQVLVFGLFSFNVVLFSNNVGLKRSLFLSNVVPKMACYRVEAFLFLVPYN